MGAREITIVGSLVLHGAIGLVALSAAHDKKAHRATEVALGEQKKKEKPPEPKKLPDPPKPPPVAKPIVPRTIAPVAAAPAAAAAAPTSAPSAPMSTDISMGNDTGMDMGTNQKTHEEQKLPAPAKPTGGAAPAKPTHIEQKDAPHTDAAECTEPPGKPEPAQKTDIAYTEEARAAGIEGRLVLKVTVDAEGNVTDVKVVNGVDAALDAAAIQTVKTWRFKPAMACGKPVAGGSYTIARRFVLGD